MADHEAEPGQTPTLYFVPSKEPFKKGSTRSEFAGTFGTTETCPALARHIPMCEKSGRLREQAIRAERLAQSISDFEAGQTLKALARQFQDEADRLDAGLTSRSRD